MRLIKVFAWLIVGLFVVVPALFASLFMTTTGSNFLLSSVTKLTNIELNYSRLEGDLSSSFIIHNAVIRNASVTASIDSLEVSWRPLALLDGQLIFKNIDSKGLAIQIEPATSEHEAAVQINELPNISLPLELLVENLSATDSSLTTPTTANQVLPNVEGALKWKHQALEVQHIRMSYNSLVVRARGKVATADDYPLALTINWQLDDISQQLAVGTIRGDTSINGNLTQVIADSEFLISGNSNPQQLHFEIDQLLTKPKWRGKLDFHKLEMSVLHNLLSEQQSEWISWLLTGQLDARASFNNQQIDIEQLQLSKLGEKQGRIEFVGQVSDYLLITTEPNLVQFTVNAEANDIVLPLNYEQQSFVVDSLDSALTGTLASFSHESQTSGFIGGPEHPFTLTSVGVGSANTIEFASVKVASDILNAQFSGVVNWQEELNAQLNLKSLSLHTEDIWTPAKAELTAQGHIHYVGNRLSAQDLQLEWLDNSVLINGAMTESAPLAIIIDMPKLENLYKNDYLSGHLQMDFNLVGEFDKNIKIHLDSLDLNHPEFGRWQTQTQGLIDIPIATPGAFTAKNICVVANSRRSPAKLCLESLPADSLQTTTITGENLPLALLNRFRSNEVAERVWGLASLTTRVTFNPDNLDLFETQGQLRSERTILFALDEEVSTSFDYWQIDWQGNAELIATEITAELQDDQGTLLGDLEIQQPLAGAQLNGDLLFELRDLTLLQWVLPDLRYEDAQALASIQIAGTRVAPDITGSVELAAREIAFAQSGLLLTDVRLSATDTPGQDNAITLMGQAQSGSGWIAIDGQIHPLEPALQLSIKGDGFRALQLPTATVDVSPDIQIQLKNQRIDVTGEVLIPFAEIQQPELQEFATVPSSDVIVLDQGQPVTKQDDALYPLHADIRVTLGEHIKVSAFGFEGDLSGSLRVMESPSRALTASGNVSVEEGFYEIYGQRLEIDRGSLIYNGGPINNPGLDLKVSRANENIIATEQVSVGAQVNGTLIEPEFRLYSTPAMPDSEILSYLVLGRGSGVSAGGNENLQLQALLLLGSKGTEVLGAPLQEAFGLDDFGIDSTMNPNDTSFYIGKYLSPKLYVKYGVGLFENTNTFLIRYLLTEKLIIETTTSGEAQGGDIFYTIEN